MSKFRITAKLKPDYSLPVKTPFGCCAYCHRPIENEGIRSAHKACADSAEAAWTGRRRRH
ncbi:hypothetical protein ABZ114_22505 [Streptomyces albidoflavus]|uniref:hypothetical protein n=1 Tax=Streptomyces albidoflavus TaxID=1886 RepID=UPI0033B46955